MSYEKILCMEHSAEREMRITERSKKKKGCGKNFLCYGEPTPVSGALEDVGAIAAMLAEVMAEETERLEQKRIQEMERSRSHSPRERRNIPSSPAPNDTNTTTAVVGGRRPPSGALVRYIRPTLRCRRERLFAYHMAKKMLQQKQEEDARRAAPLCDSSRGTSVLRTSFTTSTTGSNNLSCIEGGTSTTLTDGDPWGKASLAVGDNLEKCVYDALHTFVTDYEQRYGRQPRVSTEKVESPSFSTGSSAVHDFNMKNEGEKNREQLTTTMGSLIGNANALSGVFKFPFLQETKTKANEGVNASAPFFSAAFTNPEASLTRGTMGDSTFTGFSSPDRASPKEDGASEKRLAAEREQRTESVKRLVKLTLKRLSNPGHCRKSSPGPHSHDGPAGLQSSFSPSCHSVFGGLWDITLDKRIDSAPHGDLIKLAGILSCHPGLQKCSEAAARFVTYVLMRSLPEELFTGDPEDYCVLRRRVHNAVKNRSSPGPKIDSRMSSSEKVPLPPRKASPRLTRLRFSSSSKKSGKSCSLLSTANSVGSSDDGEQRDDRYFLHRDTSTCQQVLQSVALRHGYWLSSTERMLQRPPFHACGLPLRTARDIAMWQRPPCREPLGGGGDGGDGGATFNATDTTKDPFADTALTTATSSKLTKTTCHLEAEARLFEGSLHAESSAILRDEVVGKNGGRPKTIAPLLILAHGGYGVAPFSVPDSSGVGMTVEKEVDCEEGQGYRRHLANMNNMTEADQDAYLATFLSPDDFLHPEPSLLPLYSVMQTIYSSVRQNRNIYIDDATHNSLPIVLDLLMDVVESYEDFFQSIIDTSFEPAGMRSFFLHTYREMILSWAAIVVCETAIEYATERVAVGPTGKSWVTLVGAGSFTEVQLEKIALSGLVQRTFPSMTQVTYDENLLGKTIEKVRDVVLGTIVRVRGELYYLVTGVDNRRLFMEQYQKMLREEKEMQAAMQAEVEEQMNARLPGCSKTGGEAPPQQEKPGLVTFPLNESSLVMAPKRCGSAAPASSSNASQSDNATAEKVKRSLLSTQSETSDRTPCESTVLLTGRCAKEQGTSRVSTPLIRLPSRERRRQERRRTHLETPSTGRPSSRMCSDLHTAHPSEGYVSESRLRSSVGGDAPYFSNTARTESRSNHWDHFWRKGPQCGFSSASVSRRRARRQGGFADLPQDLTVRNVRRELVSLHMRRNEQRKSSGLKAGASKPYDTPWGTNGNGASTLGLSSVSVDLHSPVADIGHSLSPERSGAGGHWASRYGVDRQFMISPLAAVVGARQAQVVEQMRRAFQNTVQFQVHFQETSHGGESGVPRALHESQWYVTGNSEYYERRTVALIRRSRQVAAFDLRHLSPITTLGMCVQRSSRGFHRYDPQPRPPHVDHNSIQPKDLHLGRNIVPWTL